MRITDRFNILESVVHDVGDGTINILITSVDFDAVGSAVGLYYLLRELGGNARIFYLGSFALRQKSELRSNFNLHQIVKPYYSYRRDPHGDFIALVDSCDVGDDRLGPLKNKIDPVIIIDHHQALRVIRNKLNFIVLDTSVSAASTLVIELLQKLQLLERATIMPFERRQISVMLAMGIYTDSRGLTHMTSRDEDAYEYICGYIDDMRDLDHLICFPSPDEAVEYQRFADRHNLVEGDTIIASVGSIKPMHIHEVSVVADQFVQRPGINIAIVYGALQINSHDARLKVSVRQRHCDKLHSFDTMMKNLFGQGAGGRFDGNGGAMGGADLVLGRGVYDRIQQIETDVMRRISKRLKAIYRVA